jgi:hypothetical protein
MTRRRIHPLNATKHNLDHEIILYDGFQLLVDFFKDLKRKLYEEKNGHYAFSHSPTIWPDLKH